MTLPNDTARCEGPLWRITRSIAVMGRKKVELTVTANGKSAYRITVEALEGADHD